MAMMLDEYTTTDTDRGVGLTCPRKDCGAKFIVNYKQMLDRKLKAKNYGGRPVPIKTIVCPCCSRVSAIPASDLEEYGHTPSRHTKEGQRLERERRAS